MIRVQKTTVTQDGVIILSIKRSGVIPNEIVKIILEDDTTITLSAKEANALADAIKEATGENPR